MSDVATNNVITVGLSVIAVLIASLARVGVAQDGEPRRVFTSGQAAAGKAVFEKSCVACHQRDLAGDSDVPPLAGAQFMSTWGTRTTKDLFEYISTAMPPGSSSMTADTYLSLAAYLLQFNGAVAGPSTLTSSTAVPIDTVTERVKK